MRYGGKTKEELIAELAELRQRISGLETSEAGPKPPTAGIRNLSLCVEGLVDDPNILLAAMDREGNVLVWNKAAEVATGWSREQVLGHNKVWEWLYPDAEYRRAIIARGAKVMQVDIVYGMELSLRTKSGEERRVSSYTKRLVDEHGSPTGIVCAGSDVSERRESREEMIRILGWLGHGITATDLDGQQGDVGMRRRMGVLVATTEPLLADGIAAALMRTNDLRLECSSSDLMETVALARQRQPRVAVVDCDLADSNHFQAIEEIRQAAPMLEVIALVGRMAPSHLSECVRAGMAAYVPKTAAPDRLVETIRLVRNGDAVLPIQTIRGLVQQLACGTVPYGPQGTFKRERLTQKELEVLKLASDGQTNKQIAQRLFISERTVQSRFSAIFRKLEARSRSQAVSVAWKSGWIQEPDSSNRQ